MIVTNEQIVQYILETEGLPDKWCKIISQLQKLDELFKKRAETFERAKVAIYYRILKENYRKINLRDVEEFIDNKRRKEIVKKYQEKWWSEHQCTKNSKS
jgi:hypothetical protein